ncbi:Ras subfamily protein [Acanthamoeba castellanii str. Neff]|uniref:Ras subfamily protein n=1 Tax=Acanthamoeba castellanii (strain ATCC 30010 / Neff) TaxID=1257118 RepID=L8HLU5_ACACF|nr:Ras subfamily protein [Acanthamoeba castellanii str. Neff]ELR25396.1 Ras subfamily protein [Acanthamoeba castellanii str. Neff]
MWAPNLDEAGRRDAATQLDFSQLPNEVAEHVLSYLGVADLYEGALVYMKEIEVDGVMATLEITVTAGQEEFQALLEPVLRGCDGVLALYSVTNEGHLGQVEDSLRLVRQTKETDDRDAPPIILLGNKLDLSTERAIVPAQGKQLADQFAVYSRSIASDNKTAKQKNKNKNKKTTTIKNDDGQCFRFVRNFFECSVKENYVIDYHPRFFATAHDATRWSSGHGVQPPAEAKGLWTVHRDQMTVVFEEMVRQIDAWRHAKQLRPSSSEGDAKDKKCLVS